jgi:ribose transport system substrate-binding protein
MTLAWDSTPVPAIKKAMAAGIPVIVLYTTVPDSGALGFIGLDNYQCGVDTGKELIKRGGTKGKLGIIMNAGASNTEAKKAGALAALKGTQWEVVVQAEDKANTEVAIEAAKSMFNSHPEITGVLGLDSSSGTGIGRAIEELGLLKKEMTIVVHDREDVTLEYIDKGIIDATIEAKTALGPYLAIAMLEDYNDRKMENDVPISADNWKSGVKSFPEFIYVGSVVIDKTNVKNFMRRALPRY